MARLRGFGLMESRFHFTTKRASPIHKRPTNRATRPRFGCRSFTTTFAPEHHAVATGGKPGEICTTLCNQPNSWGYLEAGVGRHRSPDELWKMLNAAREQNFNLLANTGPRPDGSLDAQDVATLRAVGARLRAEGFRGEAQVSVSADAQLPI